MIDLMRCNYETFVKGKMFLRKRQFSVISIRIPIIHTAEFIAKADIIKRHVDVAKRGNDFK